MNGVASAAMRQAGMTDDYRVNFGVELPRLAALADECREGGAELAQALWKESVRECRILALMIYPAQEFDGEMADVWAESIRTVELAQLAAHYLFAHIKGASDKGFEWIAAESPLTQTLGYYTLIHVVRGRQLSERSADELRDQIAVALQSDNMSLRQAAMRLSLEISEMDAETEE